ncbi:MAG: putative peptide zinc metalloprotease protein [Actinomycetota bacterium]|nr:putative peptide zinc metalloprotease protein [Actinomycetota bacterium]
MRTLSRLLLVALVAHAAAFAAFAVPVAAQSQDNTAVAVNKKDGKSVFKLAFSVKKASGDVNPSNAAVAYSSCTDCKTVAAAIQVVLVSDAGSVEPENLSLAINYQCSECETLAAAYQFVFADGQEVEFTKEGKERLHDLKKRFQDLKHRDDLTLEQLAAEISAIAAEVAEVVDTEVVLKKDKEAKEAKDAATAESTTTTAGDASVAPATSPPTSTDTPSTTTAPTSASTTSAPTTSPPTSAGTSATSPSTTAGP